jgi:AcrR family transcriptional regulator
MATTIGQPQNARSRRSRAALLDATRALIEERGFDGLTMAAIAERAGVTRRAAYLHFATRAELVTALYRRLAETEDIASSLQKVWDSPGSVAALGEWARHIARIHPKILPVMQAVERARHTDPDAEQLWQTGQRGWLAGSRRLADWLALEHQLAPPWTPTTAADMLWSLMSIDLLDRLLRDRRWSPKRAGDHLAALLTAAFTPQTERSRK